MEKEAESVIIGNSKLRLYGTLLANVRRDGRYHDIKSLVQPDDPDVREVARILHQTGNFIEAAQEFVNAFTEYETEEGDYWCTPAETLAARKGDCDDKAILLVSILRNYLPQDQVYCAFGMWYYKDKLDGHMWVITDGNDGQDRILESTAGAGKITRGRYILHGMFNDQLAFCTNNGLKEFALKPVIIV